MKISLRKCVKLLSQSKGGVLYFKELLVIFNSVPSADIEYQTILNHLRLISMQWHIGVEPNHNAVL